MKKLLSIVLSLLMILVPMASLAEEPNVYIHDDESYGFAYPTGWLLLTKETLDEIYAEAAAEEGSELQALLQAYVPMLQQADMVMVMAPNLQDNINIVRQDIGTEVTPNDLLSMSAAIQEQLRGAMPGIEFLSEPELMEAQEDFPAFLTMMYAVQVDNMPTIGIQMITSVGTELYTCTMTACSMEEEDQMAAVDAMEIITSTLTVW